MEEQNPIPNSFEGQIRFLEGILNRSETTSPYVVHTSASTAGSFSGFVNVSAITVDTSSPAVLTSASSGTSIYWEPIEPLYPSDWTLENRPPSPASFLNFIKLTKR